MRTGSRKFEVLPRCIALHFVVLLVSNAVTKRVGKEVIASI